jgi:hypothetical protein
MSVARGSRLLGHIDCPTVRRAETRVIADPSHHPSEGEMHTDQAQSTIEQPFQPDIPRSRFARGILRRERTDEERRLGRFSDGQQATPTAARGLDRGRFSQGQELTIDENPEKHIRRRYSEGLETKRPSISGSPGVGEEASRFPICARTIGHACS